MHGPEGLLPLLMAAGYLWLVVRARRRGPWPGWRTGAFLFGVVLVAVALLPPIGPWAHDDFRGHMLQHMLIGMYAPIALVLGAPVTLLLRALPARQARRVTALLRSRAMRVLADPVVALLLSVGVLGVLYYSPLYGVMSGQPVLHHLLHLHFLLAGCLFAWVIAGPDPAPHRPGVPARLVLLGVAVAAHATVSQLMYSGLYLRVDAPAEQIQGAAQIMYYGGDIAELLLAAALVAAWRPARAGADMTSFSSKQAQAVRGPR
ncbi:hypothetical protein ACRB68_45830 [Actinomadura sp. RB68]|uniref:Cytochrome c oxidase assembly protein n=2 Tax=Actinomadura macrotermitis TaxID=2585200 RepID=A0A7K0BZ90_9ACTN|nr:hypothetical protein [Actinomadura macrotermitis]